MLPRFFYTFYLQNGSDFTFPRAVAQKEERQPIIVGPRLSS